MQSTAFLLPGCPFADLCVGLCRLCDACGSSERLQTRQLGVAGGPSSSNDAEALASLRKEARRVCLCSQLKATGRVSSTRSKSLVGSEWVRPLVSTGDRLSGHC